ncbi:DUF551 domain-containing protein [Citrobacter freundii]
MTTNNHPANGPVSLDRLHQIREILSKAAAQSDGGNLGYAMADAVKVIDGTIAVRNAGQEPVAWVRYCSDGTIDGPLMNYQIEDCRKSTWTPLYAAPQLPQKAVADDIGEIRVGRLPTMNKDEYPGLGDWWVQLRIGENADEVLARVYGDTPREANNRAVALVSRAAMLQAGNSPVIPDGWIPVSEQMPDEYDFDIWVFSLSEGVQDGVQWDGDVFADDEYQYKLNDVSHWMKKLYPAAPQQEVKP